MIKHVGDASNLILDGDLDTYYLVDANFNAFSGMLKDLALAKSIGYASLHANNGTLDSQAADALRPLADTLEKEFIAHAAQSITTAINQDSNYHGLNATLQTKVSEKLANFEKDAKDTAAMLRSITKGGSKDAGQFIETMDIPHDETAELAIESLNALHEMILVRIAVLKNERMLIMGEVLGLIVLAFVLFLIVSNSITRPIKAMTAVMRKLADGDTGVEIPSTQSKDEVGEMARTVLVFKDSMIHTEELRAEQEAQKLRAAEEKRAAMHAMANNFEMSVKSVVTEVSASASQMRGNAERLSQLAGETKSNSAIVSSSATEAAQTATQVAAAAEELAAAIGEISAQVQKSSGETLAVAHTRTTRCRHAACIKMSFSLGMARIKNLAVSATYDRVIVYDAQPHCAQKKNSLNLAQGIIYDRSTQPSEHPRPHGGYPDHLLDSTGHFGVQG